MEIALRDKEVEMQHIIDLMELALEDKKIKVDDENADKDRAVKLMIEKMKARITAHKVEKDAEVKKEQARNRPAPGKSAA